MKSWRVLLLLGLPVSAAHAAVDCGEKPVRLAFYEFGLLYNNGRGIDKDVVDALRQRTGCRFEISVMPRARIWQDLENGALDMSVSGIQNPARDRFAWFAPYMALKNMAVTTPPSATPDAFLKRDKAKWAAVRAFKHGQTADRFLEQMRQQGRVIDVPDVASAFTLLKAGRVEGMFAQSPVYRLHLQAADLSGRFTLTDWASQEAPVPHALILSKSRFTQSQAEAWQKQVNELVVDGSMLRILRQHLPADEARAQMLTPR